MDLIFDELVHSVIVKTVRLGEFAGGRTHLQDGGRIDLTETNSNKQNTVWARALSGLKHCLG